jgi:putative transposase
VTTNPQKKYIKGGVYHIFNRGVNKNLIFIMPQDFGFFMRVLKESLTPRRSLLQEYIARSQTNQKFIKRAYLLKESQCYAEEISLIRFCLMPNHYHLLLKQNGSRSMTRFMRSIQVRYAMYFNKKYERVGPLFQGRYKAIPVQDPTYFKIVANYIHTNPISINLKSVDKYPWSSASVYSGRKKFVWISQIHTLEGTFSFRGRSE